jgi:acetoin utilization deacetylase AcuC-like enzyme
VGIGGGRGFTVNLPIEAGASDDDYRIVFSEVVVPVLRRFAPDLLLVSAGFDAHERDPLAGMRLSTGAFAAMTMELRLVAQECCGGKMALVTEGGYDLQALASSLEAVVLGVTAPLGAADWPSDEGRHSRRGRATVEAARRVLSSFWTL